jgi:CubicO group peptidase (beta-lactamase class C family)
MAKLLRPLLAALLAAFLGSALMPVRAADLPRAAPESLGFAPDRLARIGAMLQDRVRAHAIPGAVLLIARHGRIAWLQSVGYRDPGSGAPMTDDTIFRIYSMSKPITVAAALMLVEAGQFAFSDPISRFLPQFAHPEVGVTRPNPSGGDSPVLQLVSADRPITVQDLMRHSSGLTYGFFGDTLVKKVWLAANLFASDMTNAEFVDRVAKLPLAYQPGTTWDYGVSIDVLGRLIEVVSGEPLYRFEKANLLDPLGMTDTSFYVTGPHRRVVRERPLARRWHRHRQPAPRWEVGIGRRRHGRDRDGLRAVPANAAEWRRTGRPSLS